MIEIIYNIKHALKVIFFPGFHVFSSSWEEFSKCVTCLANPLASSAKKKKKRKEKDNITSVIQDMQRSEKSSATGKDTKYHLLYLKCKYTYDEALCVQFVVSCENPQSFKWKRDIYFFVLRLFFHCLFVGYSWLERISICLSGARKPAQISASCWAKAQLNPCKPNVYPMWK